MTLLEASRLVIAAEDATLSRDALDLRNPLALREAEAAAEARRTEAWRQMWRVARAEPEARPTPLTAAVWCALDARIAWSRGYDQATLGALEAAIAELRKACE